jgi:chromate transporter
MDEADRNPNSTAERIPARQVFAAFLRLGLTSFGGPIAHIGYFRDEFVTRRKWLNDESYADLVALCQFLPGPASSQVGIGIGLAKSGLAGAVAAWIGFTLPSAIALFLFALGILALGDKIDTGLLHGMKVVAVAVVAQAIWGMAKTLCPDAPRATIAVAAAIGALAVPTPLGQISVIVLAGLIGLMVMDAKPDNGQVTFGIPVKKSLAISCLILFFTILLGLPALNQAFPSQGLAMADAFYRSGSLVFGGGHVLLPLLQSEVVPPGWVSQDAFLVGYGAAQAVPGPLFTFAAYLGAVMEPEPNGIVGAAICLIAIFASSFLLVTGVFPFWDSLRRLPKMRQALIGINAAVVGLLGAAFYDPVWTSAIRGPGDFSLALAAFVLLVFWKVPPWAVVILTAIGGAVIAIIQ